MVLTGTNKIGWRTIATKAETTWMATCQLATLLLPTATSVTGITILVTLLMKIMITAAMKIIWDMMKIPNISRTPKAVRSNIFFFQSFNIILFLRSTSHRCGVACHCDHLDCHHVRMVFVCLFLSSHMLRTTSHQGNFIIESLWIPCDFIFFFSFQYRPSRWHWRRGEPRYTAASIHM